MAAVSRNEARQHHPAAKKLDNTRSRVRMMPVYARGLGSPNRNFWLGVYNGVLVNGAEAFFHSSLVLAPFLAQLGAPAAVIGLIPALRVGGWLLPQLFVASRLAHQPFKLPWYRRVSLLRFAAFAGMTLSVFLLRGQPQFIVPVVLAMLALNAVGSGVSGVSFADVTAKVVPHYRLGTFWALRNAVGGLLALLSGLVLRRVLASDLAFPVNFGVLFLVGTTLTGFAYLSFSLIREPAGKPALKEPFRHMLGRIPEILREDVSFRRYMRVRFLGAFGASRRALLRGVRVAGASGPAKRLRHICHPGYERVDYGELSFSQSRQPGRERDGFSAQRRGSCSRLRWWRFWPPPGTCSRSCLCSRRRAIRGWGRRPGTSSTRFRPSGSGCFMWARPTASCRCRVSRPFWRVGCWAGWDFCPCLGWRPSAPSRASRSPSVFVSCARATVRW